MDFPKTVKVFSSVLIFFSYLGFLARSKKAWFTILVEEKNVLGPCKKNLAYLHNKVKKDNILTAIDDLCQSETGSSAVATFELSLQCL